MDGAIYCRKQNNTFMRMIMRTTNKVEDEEVGNG